MDDCICYTIETQAGFIPLATNDSELLWMYLPVASYGEASRIISSECGNISSEQYCRFADLDDLLISYFDSKPVDFSNVPVDLSYTTEFGRSVLTELRRVPYGCVVSYAELAGNSARPGAARAVGTVLGHNRTPLVLPCHRVIAANHKIGGFSAGLDWKYRLLNIEGVRI